MDHPLRQCLRTATSPEGRGNASQRVDAAKSGIALGSPFGSNDDDRRQWRIEGGVVGAAASRMRAERSDNDGEVEVVLKKKKKIPNPVKGFLIFCIIGSRRV